jgi:hypothetical protein
MNKKIKVIELFDSIAKGIDIPARVEYRQKIYKFDSDIMDYVSQDEELCLSLLIVGYDNFKELLNREVEILEDEEDIEEIKVDDNNYIVTDNGTNLKGRAIDITFVNKINEIIDKVNKLDKKINKE